MFLKEVSSAHPDCICLLENTILTNINTIQNVLFEYIYCCDQSWIFIIITPVFGVTWSFRIIIL